MDKTRMSNKGQVVIPHRVREALGWKAGLEFAVERLGDGVALRPMGAAVTADIDEVFGCLEYRGQPKTLAEMEAAIAAGARARR